MNVELEKTENASRNLAISLMLLRLGIGVVFLMWTIDKFINPGHAASVFERFYMIKGLTSTLAYAVGAVQLCLVGAFLVGACRWLTYPIVMVLHAISTFSSYAKYVDPWTYPNLLFFAAIPMLSACTALWLLRDHDTMLSVDAWRLAKQRTQIQ